MDESRLARIEGKLDKLTEAVTSIARVEEKIYASTKRVDRLEQRMDGLEEELDVTKGAVVANGGIVKFAERMFWIAVSALVSVFVYFVR